MQSPSETVLDPNGQVLAAPQGSYGLANAARQVLFGVLLVRASLDNALNALGGPIGAVLNIVVIAAAVILLRASSGDKRNAIGPVWPIFFVLCGFSILHTPDKVGAVRYLATLLTYCALFAAPFGLIRHPRDIVKILNVIIASSAVPIIYGFIRFDAERAQSTFPHPNIFAFYLAVLLITLVFVWFSRLYSHTTAERALLAGVGGAASLLLVMTQTRGAWVGIALAFGLIALLHHRKLLWGALFAPLLLLVPQIQERLLDLKGETEFIGNGIIVNSYEWRLMLWDAAFTWIRQDPIFGYGLFSFQIHAPTFFFLDTEGFNAHSVYVQLLFETGVFGFLAYVALFLWIAWGALKNYRRSREAAAFTIALVAFYMSICYSDNILGYLSFNWYFWLLLGTLRASMLLRLTDEADA
ncbi:O-antigen ligase [uncultured Alsobacter sp.]|uniref:O-antigen ligase family protein n=1 Tax=uncultured Alsobacter sp. TaxID=1748258 RepID=UPI0025EADC57|nr:O-antigen ligase family protein [uncultured Alsobacter sp.]